MGLLESIASLTHTPVASLRLDGRAVRPISISVDLGYDSVSSRAVIDLPAIPDWARFRQQVDIDLGWDGFTVPAFRGFVEDDGRSHAPIVNTMQAAGQLRKAQYQALRELPFAGLTDGQVVFSLLFNTAGVTALDIDDDGLELGTVKVLRLEKGSTPWDLINKIDQVTGHKTFDAPTLVMRRYVSGIPAATAAFDYVEDQNIYSARRDGTMRQVHNRVEAYGLPQPSGTPGYFWYGFSPLVPIPPGYFNFDFRSDLIETTAVANNVARRLLGEMNRATEDITIEIPGNPLLIPTMTVSLLYPSEGIVEVTNYSVKHVTHRFGAPGFATTAILTGGLGNIGLGGVIPSDPIGSGPLGTQPGSGDPGPGTGPGSGGPGPTTGVPIAQFITRVNRETYDVGGVPTDHWTVFADASGSVDTDTPPGGLTYAWSNNVNADAGTGQFYATSLTEAQITAGVIITLTVTDVNGDVDIVTQTVSLTASTILVRDLYVAAGSRAEATPDGGKTWATWTPAAGTVVSTPEIAGNISYFGLSNGELWYTTDRLATAPTLAHTFGSQVECIWINEINANRVTVGLQSGEIWQTNDAGSVASSTWVLLSTQAAPVLWLIESMENQGELRIATGSTIRLSLDNGATWSDQITFSSGATARKSALSFFTNYGSASVAVSETDAVQTEAGASITFPVVVPAVEDVRAITHHIREDVLYAADLNGTTLRSWQKAEGASVFTAKATMASAGRPNHMIRDGANQLTHYIACDEMLAKTFDGFGSIVRLRDYSAGGLVGYQCGYGAITAISVGGGGSGGGPGDPPGGGGGGGGSTPIALTILSTNGEGSTFGLGVGGTAPAGWTEPAFDDSGWSTAATETGITAGIPTSGGAWITHPAYNGDGPHNAVEWLYRREFTLPAGVVSSGSITLWPDNFLIGLWVNNLFIAGSPTLNGERTFAVPASAFIAGGANVVAIQIKNEVTPAVPTQNPTSMAYKLVVS